MKYFSLTLALFVCAVVVSAAPSSPSPSFEELAFNPLDKINQKIQEYYKKFLCARDVIEKAVEKTEFQKDFDEFKGLIESFFDDIKKCKTLKCKILVVDALPEYFVNFFEKIDKKNKDLSEMIQQETYKCFVSKQVFEFEETFAPSVAEQFQCIADVLGQVSIDNGLEESWSRTQPILQRHIDNMKQCPSYGKKYLVVLCKIRESIAIYKNYIEYLQLIAQQNPQALQDFIKGVNQKCAGQALDKFDIMFEEPMMSLGIVEKLKCVDNAISQAVKDSDYAYVYEELHKDLEQVANNIKACKTQSNALEKVKCVYAELKPVYAKISKFLHNLHKANSEIYELARKYIKKCAA